MQVIPYLKFNGNCKSAMKFYQKCFGGVLQLQTVGESPLSETMPKMMKNLIVHATIENKNFKLSGTDLVDDSGLKVGNNLAVLVRFDTNKKLASVSKKLCNKLITKETSKFRIGEIWNFKDRYGIEWLFFTNKNG